ncbi:Na+/H+ antiporter family protein [Brevibacterium sp. HMSC24B04]|uniref:Na+/H+ antiporter family protein n=1 Tax=Brevibacterium sp. HMSC24B04 TaxID=1581060 RepID=UPI000AC4CE9C|nr:Na+/H+ antiporter NhaC family protein [Brevibacterium sp. HMSC24B04]
MHVENKPQGPAAVKRKAVSPTAARPTFFEVLPPSVLAAVGGLAAVWILGQVTGHPINAVVFAILVMVTLCLVKVPVIIALVSSAILGGLQAGLSMEETLAGFNDNLLSGAQVGLTYVMIGALAVALSRSGLLELFAQWVAKKTTAEERAVSQGAEWGLFGLFAGAAVLSQNLVPVHIAFIPILLPPLLGVLNRLRIDRRAVAVVLACSMSASYLLLPTGFGAIYLNEILLTNVNEFGGPRGLTATPDMAWKAMFWPVMGLAAGMLTAVLFSYRKPRDYPQLPQTDQLSAARGSAGSENAVSLHPFQLIMTLIAVAAALVFQIAFDSLLVGGMIGFLILTLAGVFRWREQDDVFTQGVLMMSHIAIIITVASGFAGLLNATGEIDPLIAAVGGFIGDNTALGVFLMLFVGLFITIGFGDSFASVPILAPIYIPLALEMGLDPLAAVCLLGASAGLGDAGSPASTISLGVTSGLAADGHHDHIRDTVIPTFLHCNIGVLLFAGIAVLML